MIASRRQFLFGSAALATAALLPSGAAAQKSGTRIILLGTKGGPTVGNGGRSNAATLLLIDGEAYVVDCGYGVTRQLVSAGVRSVRYIVITHHHSDHDLEYGALIYNGWVGTPQTINIDAYGPKGLEVVMPTKLYGYVAGGEDAAPAAEKPYIEKIRKEFYSPLAQVPAPLRSANFLTYGASTTPTLVLVDAAGIVRYYHPGAASEAELAPRIQKLLGK